MQCILNPKVTLTSRTIIFGQTLWSENLKETVHFNNSAQMER